MTATRRSQEKNKETGNAAAETVKETEDSAEAAETDMDTAATENQDTDVEMKAEADIKTEESDEKKEESDEKKEEKVEIKEDDETKKNRLVDQLYKAEFLKSVTDTVTLDPVKSLLLKNEEFIGLLSKAKLLDLHMENQSGTAKLTFAPYREWMALRILKGLNRLQKEDSKLTIECSDGLKELLEQEKAGKLKGDSREQQTSKCLYVTNIPKDTTEETLKAFFPKCVKVYVRAESEESDLGWAAMEFSTKAEMEEGFESQKEIEIGESKIPVSKVKAFERKGKGFKGKGKFQKGGFKGAGDKGKSPSANKTRPGAVGGDKPKGQQSSMTLKANDLKRKAQNQKMQQFNNNSQKRRKLGAMGSGMGGGMGGGMGYQFGNRGKNMRGMSLLGNPRGGNSMMNLGIGPSVPNMMGMGNNMGNMMGMGNMGGMGSGMGGGMGGGMGSGMGGGMGSGMGGGMGSGMGGGMGMSQNMGMMGSSMGNNMSSFNNNNMGGGNMGNQKNRRNNKRGGNGNAGGQWSGGRGQDGHSDELSSKLSNVLSKQRMGKDSDSEMVSMLQSALKAAQERMSNKDSSDSGRMLPPNAFSNSGSSGGMSKKQRQQRQKKQNSSGGRFSSGSGSSGNYGSSGSGSSTSFISTTSGNYGGNRDSNWNSGSNYDSTQSYGDSGSSNYYGGGGYSATTDQTSSGSYFDQGNYGSTSSFSDSSSYKPATQSYDYSSRSSSDSYYRSGYY